jgi:hypothetical protein
MLSPGDRQNVNAAVSLINSFIQVGEILATNQEHGPFGDSMEDIILFGRIISAYFAPFTEMEWSLDQQLHALAMCSHMLLLVHRMRPKYLDPALYHDMQVSIKAIFIFVARAQIEFPDMPCYIGLIGTDQLESTFGIIRTLSHNRCFDALELSCSIGNVLGVTRVFSRHPDWERASRRLNLKNSKSDVDGINPASWKGDVSVRNVNLEAIWNVAATQSREVLNSRNFGPRMLPNGVPPSVTTLRPLDPTKIAGFKEADSLVISQYRPPAIPINPDDNIEAFEAPNFTVENTFDLAGTTVFKASAIRVMFHDHFGESHADRLKRVKSTRTFSQPTRQHVQDQRTEFMIKQVFVTLVRRKTAPAFVCMAVVVCDKIEFVTKDRETGRYVKQSVVSCDLNDREKVHELSGQILVLDARMHGLDEALVWTTEMSDMLTGLQQNMMVPVDPESVYIQVLDKETQEARVAPSLSFDIRVLEDLATSLWIISADQNPDQVKMEVNIGETTSVLPYQFSKGAVGAVHQAEESLLATDVIKCHLCKVQVPLKEMRRHVGYHISKNHYSYTDPCGWCGLSEVANPTCTTTLKVTKQTAGNVNVQSTCRAFCSETKAGVAVTGKPSGRNVPVFCPLGTENNPCGVAIWRYNFNKHCEENHPTQMEEMTAAKVKFGKKTINIKGVEVPFVPTIEEFESVYDAEKKEGRLWRE